MSLSNLGRELPNLHEFDQIFTELITQTDRGAALMAGAFLDRSLRLAIMCRFVQMSKEDEKRLFEGDTAPLGTSSSMIKAGKAMGIYGNKTRRHMDTIRQIRNAFAHALKPLSFDHPDIVTECKKLDSRIYVIDLPAKVTIDDHHPARRLYSLTAMFLSKRLYLDAEKNGGKKFEIDLPSFYFNIGSSKHTRKRTEFASWGSRLHLPHYASEAGGGDADAHRTDGVNNGGEQPKEGQDGASPEMRKGPPSLAGLFAYDNLNVSDGWEPYVPVFPGFPSLHPLNSWSLQQTRGDSNHESVKSDDHHFKR